MKNVAEVSTQRSSLKTFKTGVHVKAVLTWFNAYNHNRCFAALCKDLGDFWSFWERDIFFSKNRFNWGKYKMLKIWCVWKIEIRGDELVDRYQTVPFNLGLSFGAVKCLVVFPTRFNPNNSLLMILQISLLFTCTPALIPKSVVGTTE